MFSLANEKAKLPDAAFFLGAVGAWLLSACILLVISTVGANLAGLGEQGLGYLSSLLSFLCAVSAGAAAVRRSGAPRFLTAILTGTGLVILLLTAGFLTKGGELDPSSVLSVVSFSYAGALLGAALRPKTGRTSSRHAFHLKN